MFKLHSLGWYNFQQLCLSVVRERLSQTVETFLDTNDGGRDGAFAGEWRNSDSEVLAGKFVIQCKFTNRSGYTLTPSDLSDEIPKVRRLVEKGRCDIYVLMTNAGMSGVTDLKIKEQLEEVGVKHLLIFGRTWIEQQILESKQLRMMVPRVYGLGDLSQILDERAYAQAASVLKSMRDDLAKVVITESYRKAAHTLDTHGFVLLIGEPAAGKTTIASMLSVASADKWDASVLKIDHPRNVVEHWNPHEKSQFFWLDDAFGVTQYESSLAMGWNHILPQMKTILKQGCRVVMTSRDYIYNRARNDLKVGAFPLFNESQVVIDVHELNLNEKRQILYNHLKLESQPREFLTAFKPQLGSIAEHTRFIPEIARRLANPFFTKGLSPNKWDLEHFINGREEFLIDVCNGLDPDSQAALALIYMRSGHLLSPIQLSPLEEEALKRMSSNLGDCSSALQALKGSLVAFKRIDGDSVWTYQHPTIGDAYASVLRSSPELLGVYVTGSDIASLMDQVTCGDMQIEGAVILPKSLYPLMIGRLKSYTSSSAYKEGYLSRWGARRHLLSFLDRRCRKEFIEAFLAQTPDFIESISKPSLYLDWSPEVSLVMRLFELGILPEPERKTFVQTVIEYAIDGEDGRVLNDDDLRALLNDEELASLREGVALKLVPRLGEVRSNIEFNHDTEDDPEEHMQYFSEILDGIEREFSSVPSVLETVKTERLSVHEWIEEQPEEPPEIPPRQVAPANPADSIDVNRSIFDDIDE